jgi:hypothetical protein
MTGWIAAFLCAFVLSASLDKIPDPPSTAARSGPAHHFRISADHRVNPAASVPAALAAAPRVWHSVGHQLVSPTPMAMPGMTALPHAADSSPPLSFL